jgi:ABC-type polysaccharide/polyol phosphate transport system ATPase subunit
MLLRSEVMVPGQPLVELREVSKRFAVRLEAQRSFQHAFIHFIRRERGAARTFWSLRDISFSVNQRDNVGIIGANGSGKSTLLKLIAGILEPTTGDVLTNGRIASLLELGAGFHPELTGRENIFLNGSVYGLSRRQMAQRVDAIIDFAELGDLIDMPIKHYSSGMYVRLGFAVAIHTDPDLLLVDEVLTVGDASFQHKCLDGIHKFRERGGTLLLVSHSMPVIQSLCAHAIWLDHGEVRALGAPTDVVTAYLNAVAEREDAASKAQPLPAIEQGQRRGTGKIQITDVELCDGNGTRCATFVEGGPMEIRMHYYASERVEDPVFGLAIYHQNGLQMCGPNTRLGRFYIPYVEGTGEVVYCIPSLSLLEGAYLVSVAVVSRSDTEMYDSHDRAYSFRVYPGKSGEFYGLITLQGQWYLANGEETPASATPLAELQSMP